MNVIRGAAITPHPARLLGLATALPPFRLSQDGIKDRADRLFGPEAAAIVERLRPAFDNAGVRTRHSCVASEWYERPHGWKEKNALYLSHATELLADAARRALDEVDLAPVDVDAIVVVSTTGIATPSLDALVMQRLGMRADTQRLPIFGLGCAGGVIGLARAAQLARAEPGSVVLFMVVELCALTFRRGDASKSNVIASALFGDGAAAAVLSTEGAGPAIGRAGEHTWPDTLDIMGWTVEDDGLGVVFSRDIPTLTRTAFAEAARDFLAAEHLSFADIDHYVCHPGGTKVLDALEAVFGLDPDRLDASRAVLRDCGNMSAVTVMFILHRIVADGAPAGRYLMTALGPGFTAAFLRLDAP